MAGLVAAISGLCHPFEVFTILGATTLTFVVLGWRCLRTALGEALIVIVPGMLSLLPYVYLSLTVPWMRELAAQNVYKVPDLIRLLGILGIPTAFVLLNMVFGPKLRTPSDVVLQYWFAATLIVIHVPRLPWVLHEADGFGFVAALLAVRQITQIPYLRNWVSLHPRLAVAALAAATAPALFVHTGIRQMMFREGIKLESEFGMSAVSSLAERELIRWFTRHGSGRDLVIAPGNETSWMLATAPVHSFASHWLSSGTYGEQVGLRDGFYRGNWAADTAREFLRKYGINYVVVPEGSPVHRILSSYPKVALFPLWTLYHLPQNHLQGSLPSP